jgi:hypothetical protein
MVNGGAKFGTPGTSAAIAVIADVHGAWQQLAEAALA